MVGVLFGLGEKNPQCSFFCWGQREVTEDIGVFFFWGGEFQVLLVMFLRQHIPDSDK